MEIDGGVNVSPDTDLLAENSLKDDEHLLQLS